MEKEIKIARGRKKLPESTKSFTVSLRPSEKEKLEKKYTTLSLAIKTLLK